MTFGIGRSPIVIDASAAIEFIGGDRAWNEKFTAWATDDRMLLAPDLFLIETANGLFRSRNYSFADTDAGVHRIVEAGVELTSTSLTRLHEAIALAHEHHLTVYDALYLQLALDVDGELATLDRRLRTAAMAEDVEVVG